MKLPTLDFLAERDILVKIANGTDENGALSIVKEISCKCRVEQKNEVIYLKDGQKVTLLMKCFIFKNLEEFPDDVSGYCNVFNYEYTIARSSKKYNPDGSIHHIVLELI